MKQNMKRQMPGRKRKVSIPGGLIALAASIALIWIADGIWRHFLYEAPDPKVWLSVEGTFADQPTEAVNTVELSAEIVPTEEPAETTEPDPFAETQQAVFRPITVHVPSNCVMMPQESSALRSGKLLRLDSEHSYSGYEGEFVDFSGSAGGYDVRFSELETLPCVVEAMDKMAAGYQAATGLHDLLIYSTTSACSASGSIYPNELPDRASGYAIDLAYLNEEGNIVPMYSRDVWLESNAYRYGFVFSYTEADEKASGISDAPYHLRFVGKVHAGLMQELGLTLAAYQEELQKHSTDEPLFYEGSDQTYSVYYVPKSLGKTDVPVPKNGNYEISGDNETGFVVVAEGKIK